MEQKQEGTIDLLEIYHARKLRDEIVAQLRRLRTHSNHFSAADHDRRRKVRRYYEALLLTVAELQHQMGDDEMLR